MNKAWYIIGLGYVAAATLTGCGTATNASVASSLDNSMMKVYPYNSSLSIGKTNPKDDAQAKQMVFTQPNIPGLNVQTVVLNLQNSWAIKPVNAGFAEGWYSYNGHRVQNGISDGYAVNWRSPKQVTVVDFAVVTSKTDKNVTESELKSAASQFLGYAATLPYTGANPKSARKWVQSEIQNSNTSIEIGYKMGNVYFTLVPYQKLQDNQMMAELTISASTMGKPSGFFK